MEAVKYVVIILFILALLFVVKNFVEVQKSNKQLRMLILLQKYIKLKAEHKLNNEVGFDNHTFTRWAKHEKDVNNVLKNFV